MTTLKNPFEIVSPENLSPEQIRDLFVKSYTELNNLKNRKHTVIYGSRGNGKSMLLRFLEPKCQILDLDTTPEKYFASYGSFFGIYIPFREGYLNKTDLLRIPQEVSSRLSKHLINMHIITCFVDIIDSQLHGIITNNIENDIAKKVVFLLDKRGIHAAGKGTLNFAGLKDILREEISFIDEYIAFCNFPDFKLEYKGNLTDYHTCIIPFFGEIQKIIGMLKKIPFYLLFDEGDRLYQFQKAYINTMIANRGHELISVKLASKIAGYDYYYTESGSLIKEIHDFDSIVLDELYTHSKDTYFNKVKDIANRRLQLNGFQVSIEQFLPESEAEKILFEEIKKETAKQWDLLPEEDRPKDKNNFIDKYAIARLFQHLARKKTQKRYSGFENIVHFSSGIIRNYLRPCNKMFNAALDKNRDFKKDAFIPESIQNEIIYEYSDSFFGEIDEALEGLDDRKPQDKERIIIIISLRKLIENLGDFYYKKLTDVNSRDPRIISFALKDSPSIRLKGVLSFGVKESFFHKTYSSSKAGGSRYETYILNRALCPRYKIDLSSLRGRIIISAEQLEKLIDTPDEVIKALLHGGSRGKKTSKQKEMFSSSEFVEVDD